MTISDVYRMLWRQRIFVLVVVVVVVGAAYVLTSRQTKLYTASSLVRVQQDVRTTEEAFGALLTGERLARTYQRIAETDSVRELVKTQLRGAVPSDAVVVDAHQVTGLELLQISVTNERPAVAAAVANAVPAALARFIERTGSFRDTITVVERASPPGAPSSPNLRLNLMLALLLGLLLAGGLALIRETLSDRVDDLEELEKVTGHPVIAMIPNLRFELPPAQKGRRGRRVDPIRSPAGTVTTIDAAKAAEPAARWSVRG
jgi:capsular polysaccharide biosynthesis protein